MNFESLSAEPLFYMLMHSGIFVLVLGIIFFITGLLFGRATWGRYKHQVRELRGETISLKHEIADLKRKLGDHSIKAGPSASIATETIHMPKKEEAPAPVSVPPSETGLSITDAPRPLFAAPAFSPVGSIKPRSSQDAPVVVAKSEEAFKAPPQSPAPPQRITSSIKLPPAVEVPPPPAPARHASPLAAIVASSTPEPKSGEAAEKAAPVAATLPVMPELSASPPPNAVILPEFDPRLGLVYKEKPEKIDDLTALKGIAKGLEQRLHELGVYTYEQIAAWQEDQVREFSARLAFRDRIHRERWVEQAQDLAAKKTLQPV